MFNRNLRRFFVVLFDSCLVVAAILALATVGVEVENTQASAKNEESIGTWNLVSSPVVTNLKSVAMTSAMDGWIVGEGGTILHGDGSTWSTVSSPTTRTLYAVKMLSEDDGWAVGALGTILRWQGSGWNLVDSPTYSDLLAVDFLSPDEGWAVGWSSGGGPLRYGTILAWDGNAWSVKQNNMTYVGYRTVAALASNNVYAVGRYEEIWSPSNPNPKVRLGTYHWDGESWYESLVSKCNNWINDMIITSDTSGWAVGTYGCILPFNSDWTSISPVPGISSNYNLVSIDMVSPSDFWVAGGDNMLLGESKSLVFHWNGSSWDAVSNPGQKMLSDISMVSAVDGWAVGYEGTILHYTNYQYVYIPVVLR